jgi:DNA-binding transcriptional MerR regulator
LAADGEKADLKKPEKLFKTGEVLRRTGFSRQSFYQYLTLGLIREARVTEGGHHLFDESVFKRLKIIKQLNRSGYTLRDIKEVFFKED